MPALNITNRLYYVAKDFTTGLTDVQTWIKRPDLILEGPFSMTEVTDTEAAGTYYFDYVPVQQGQYLQISDSISTPKRAEQKFEVFIRSPFAVF